MAKSKNDKLDKLLSKYEKNYAINKASDIKLEPKFRSGWFALDYVLDGGFSQVKGGHIVEFYGGESSGKTTATLKVISKFQQAGKACVFVNSEGSYDTLWGEINGVDNDNLLIMQPDTLEDTGDLILSLVQDNVDLIVVDSIVNLVPKVELEKDLDEKTMGAQAAVNAVLCRKLNRIKNLSNATIIFINQLREKIGVMYGSPETTSGGRSLRHIYDTRIRFKQGKPIDVGSGDKKERIGFEIDLWAKKNKKGKPYKKSVTNFYFSGQIDNKETLLLQACKYGIIEQSGKWFSYADKKYDGKESVKQDLSDNDWLKIEDEIWKRMK